MTMPGRAVLSTTFTSFRVRSISTLEHPAYGCVRLSLSSMSLRIL